MKNQLRNQKKKVRMKLKKKIMKTMNLTRKVECTNSKNRSRCNKVLENKNNNFCSYVKRLLSSPGNATCDLGSGWGF